MDSARLRANRGWEVGLDSFIECWDGLDDPRSGNAALHDFHEILVIALCAARRGRWI
jgi:hypothetical protein